MTLHVYSLGKPAVRTETVSVNLKTRSGEITVLDNHEPLIAFVERGPIKILDAKGERHLFDSNGGFIEVRPKGDITLLIE